MVTKLTIYADLRPPSLILAKNHMVTKRPSAQYHIIKSLILAKNHMVTKHKQSSVLPFPRLILAKNHMVTKQKIA